MTNNIVIRSTDELVLSIDKVFKENLFKGELVRELLEEFAKKGMSSNCIQLLTNEQYNASNLKKEELIAFSKICYKILKWSSMNPSLYFSELELAKYESNSNIEENTNIVKLENFIKIDKFNYRGQISYEDIYKHINQNNFFYNYDTQRSPKFRSVGNKKGTKLRVQNVNTKAVEDISNAILENRFEDSEIILNCEIIEGKEALFKFEPKFEDILGDIYIKVNYDTNSDNTTWISITDGFHRCKGIVLACAKHLQKTGEKLEGNIGVRLVLADKERAKRIVHQTFLRSADEPEWVNALVKNDYSDFVELVSKNSKRLNYGNTIEEANALNKLTSKSMLIDVTKKMDIEFNKLSQAHIKSKEIANNFDLIYDLVEELKANINPYKVIAYYYLAYKYAMNKDLDIVDVVEKLESDDNFINMSKNVKNLNKYIELIEGVV